MASVGFLGLGSMGLAMAANLQKTHQVLVHNRSAGPADRLVSQGSQLANSAKHALQQEISFSMLANDSACDEVLSIENICAGTTHVCMASISPELAKKLTSRFQAAGATYISAPVLGRPNVAEAAQLHILAAGKKDAVLKVTPALEAMGQRVWFLSEEPHLANLTKIAVNYNILHAIQAIAESIALVEGSGLKAQEFVELLSSTLFGGVVYKNYGEQIANRNFEPVMFSMQLGRKDLALAQGAAEQVGIELPSSKVLAELLETALVDPQLANLDWAALAEVTLKQDKTPKA